MKLRQTEPAWVAGYVGLPFAWKGRSDDDGGLDCWGLVRRVYLERFGIALPSLDDGYGGIDERGRAVAVAGTQRSAENRWRRVETPDDLEVGDLAEFLAAGLPHVGLLVARDPIRMLHASIGSDSCVERVDSPLWAPRLLGWNRYAPPASVEVVGRSRVLSADTIDVVLPAGPTLEQLLRSAGVSPAPEISVFVGERLVPREAWRHVRPKPGRVVRVAVAPLGGGGKSPVRLLLTILTIATVAFLPGAVFGALGVTAATASLGLKIGVSLLTAGVGLGGALLANALAPPPRTGIADQGSFLTSPTLTGSRNSARPYAPFPVVLGRHRLAPVFAARPYTEIAGDDQYLRQMFAVSVGPTEITDARIGETPLAEYDGVELEIRRGNPAQRPSKLYPGQVLEQSLAVSLTSAGSWQTRTTDTDAEELSVDVAFPQGLVEFDDEGKKQPLTVDVEVSFRRVGTTPWKVINANGGTDGSPDTEAELDVLFRTPEVAAGGTGTHSTSVAWAAAPGFPNTKPGYLPADRFSWVVEGFIDVPATGSYQFGLDSSDAADVEIDGEIVCSFYGTHPTTGTPPTPNFSAATGTRTLTEGLHTFRARVECRSTPGAIAVGWRKPGDASIAVIPAGNFKRTSGNAEVSGLKYTWFRTNQYRSTISVTAARSEQIRRSLSWAVPKGQYEVRLRRTTADRTGDRQFDDVVWTSLRTIRKSPAVAQASVATVALRIKATDQLQGVVDEFNCVAGSICPDWDAALGRWVRRVTSNPASLYRYVLQHPANARPLQDAAIDLAELQAWHADCAAKGLEFNAVIDFASTMFEVLQNVAAAGRASPALKNGLHSVVRDRPVTTPVQHFTPRNSFGFKGRKVFSDLPHAVRVRFLNRDKGYQADERVVLADGYQIGGLDAFGNTAPGGTPAATIFEPLDLFGTVTADQAFKQGRFYIAAATLRPEVYEISTDIEHLVCTRGDPVRLSHDVPQFGLATGRVVGLTLVGTDLTAVKLDSACPMGDVGNFVLRFRLEDGSSVLSPVVRVAGEQLTLTLQTPIPDSSPRPKVGDLFMFGPSTLESRLCIVRAIEINQELGATLQLVDAANAIHDADVGTIPPYQSGITKLPGYADPPEDPVIESIRSDDWVMVRDADGSLRTRMLITLRRASGAAPVPTSAVVRYRPKPATGQTAPWITAPEQPIDDQQISVINVDEGVLYELSVRVVTPAGKTSGWVSTEHTVVGKVNPPPNVSTFDVVRLSDGTRQYRWTFGPVPPDIEGVVIRYGPPASTWDAMQPIALEVLQSSPTELNEPPAGTWRFAARSIDTSGNLSTSIVYIDRTLGAPSLEGVAVSDDARFSGWPGTKTGCAVRSTGELEANDSATWTTPATWAAFTRWNTTPTTPIVYEHPAVDAGVVFDFSPDVQWTALGAATVEVAWSTDGTTWSAWTAVASIRNQSVSARYMRARITVAATGGQPVPTVLAFTLLFRAVGRSIELQDVNTANLGALRVLGVGDVRLPVPTDAFTAIRYVSVSFNGTGQGWSFQVLDRDKVLGPRVQLFDATGRKRHATIDAIIRGV